MDNIHGLAAAFLRAGARAVIGALWPVTPQVAHTFFITLYSSLANDASKVGAFRTAQQKTRKEHPEYRDRGAFSFLGV